MTSADSTATPASSPAPAAGAVEALGQRAARGFAWYVAQMLGVKVINVAGQVILSWLLIPKDYGFVGLAYTIATFVGLIQQAGMREVLVQRARRFDRWAGAAFWLAALTGLLGALLMLVAAPWAAWFYQEPKVKSLIILLGVGGLINSLGAVPEAKLQSQMRFRLLATSTFLFAVFSMTLSVALAVLGFGAYAFVVPFPAMVTLRTIFLWIVAHPRVPLRFRVNRMRFLVGDNALLVGATFLLMITWQADYVVLGRMYSKDLVGLYYWAFNLSLQSVYMLAETMSGVLFPSLSRLNAEPARQRDGFLRAARAIALAGIPACFAQAVLAEPLIRLVFKEQWFNGIIIVQILSVGMAFQVIGAPAFAALKAQGRFKLLFTLLAIYAVLAIALFYSGARTKAAVGTSVAVSIYLCVSTLVSTYIVLRGGRAWRDVITIFAAPLFAGALAAAAALAAASVLPGESKPQWALRALVSAAVMAAVYLPLARWLARQTWDELRDRIMVMLQRRASSAKTVELA